MRYALIDNSTLTAVQRVLGHIPVKNKYLIDADIPALESLIQAILFYDQILFLDDYKEVHREERKDFFNKLLGYQFRDQTYKLLINKAKEITEDIVLNVSGGKIVDGDFAPFLEMLKMNLVFTWDMTSSVFYLTVKALEGDSSIDRSKYGQLSSMIYSELMEKKISVSSIEDKEPILYDSRGNRIGKNYSVSSKEAEIARQTSAFLAGLNWLAFRTTFYTLAARQFDVDLFLHPIRNAFQVNLFSKLNGNHSKFKPIINAMNNSAHETLNKVFQVTQPFVLRQDLPMFTAWLADKLENPGAFIEAAYDLRGEKIFVEARKQLIELEEMLGRGDNAAYVKQANSLVQAVQDQMKKISAQFKVDTPQGIPTSPMISVWNLSTLATGLPQIPDLDVQIQGLSFLRNVLPGRGFKAVYRTLIQDLAKVERLGKYHDIITSNVVLADDAEYFNLKVEEKKYLGRSSWWKIPM
jgi:hypothetical protein